MVHQAAVQLVRACASFAACYMFASLVPDMRTVQRTKTTGALALLPILSMLANCVCWLLYGLLRRDYFPLVVTNAIGLVFAVYYTAVYNQHTAEPRAVLRKTIATATSLALLVLYALASPESTDAIADHIGYVAMAACAVMFGSPLLAVRHVLATKSTASMPFALIAAGFVNSLLWLLYGLILADVFVVAPNLVNLFLGALQLALFALFPSASTSTSDSTAASETADAKGGIASVRHRNVDTKMNKKANDEDDITAVESVEIAVTSVPLHSPSSRKAAAAVVDNSVYV